MFNFRFETKKELRRRIGDLAETLSNERFVDHTKEKNGLRDCVGIICKGCGHAVVYRDNWGTDYFVGCDVETNCPDYKKREGT